MKLLNPSGLWLLLGVPVLIVIYLIKSQHEDRSVSSTYIWKLSSRFMKKRLPLQKLRRMLLFLLQLLMVISVSLMLARPALITGKSTEYIAIIDASASMQTKDDQGISRFDRALEQVSELSGCVDQGHRLSVILAGDKASFLLQSSDSANNIHLALNSAACGSGSCDMDDALALTQPLQQKGPTKLYFYTDRSFPDSRNIRIQNLNENEWNVSVDGIRYDANEEGEEYLVGLLTSHNRDAQLDVGLKIDGNIFSARTVTCLANTQTEVSFPTADFQEHENLELFIEEKDGLALDNAYSLCKGHQRVYNVLLVSQSPLYLACALSAMGNCMVNTVTSIEHTELTGYDLYIFDDVYPQEYPTDGSVLQFGTEKLPKGLDALSQLCAPAKLSKGSLDTPLYADLELYDTVVARYTPLTGGGLWQPLLYCGDQPVAMTYDEGTGQRFTLFSFDLHDSNLPMQTDYVVLMRNLLEHSVFDLLDKTDYTVGEDVTLNVLPAAQQLYVQLPDGRAVELSTESLSTTFSPEITGRYTAVVKTADGGDYGDFFVHIPDEEVLCPQGEPIIAPEGAENADTQEALTQLWPWLGALLLILLLAEWGVYHFEQY